MRVSIRTRWTISLLAVGAVPLALLAWTTLTIQRRGLLQAERELQVSVLDRVAVTVEHDLAEVSDATRRVGMVLTEASITSDDARLGLARDVMARANAMAQVTVYTPAGVRVDTIARTAEDGSVASLPMPERLPAELVANRPTEGSWLPPTVTPGGMQLNYVEPIARGAELRAYVVGTLSPEVIHAVLEEVSLARFRRADRLIAVDDQMRLVAAGGSQRPGSSVASMAIFRHARLSTAEFQSTVGEAVEFRDEAGVATLGSLRTLPSRRWTFVVSRPESEAYRELAAAREALVIASGLFVLLALAAGLFLGARTTRPITELAALTRDYAKRKFAVRSAVRTGDELEALGASLTQMADEIVAGEAEIERRRRVERDLSRFLPSEVAQQVASGQRALALGGERRRVTVLFADMVAFTQFSERAPPEKVVAFLNELFTVLTEVVFRHGGMVDKFMGDCLMAVFGASSDDAAQCEHALAAAEDMHRFVEAQSPAWEETYGLRAALGVGINTGEGLVGNLGSEERMEFTVIGDVVNVAARLESLARGGQTLITAEVARSGAAAGFSFNPLGSHGLRGKREGVEILEVIL